eukprot:2156273-Pyramimonas_sp.AAC.2
MGLPSNISVRNSPLRPVACCRIGLGMYPSMPSYPALRGVHAGGGTILQMPTWANWGSMLSTYRSKEPRMSSMEG